MFEVQKQRTQQTSQAGFSSQSGNDYNAQTPMQYDWIDVVKQQNSKLVQNQERKKQQDQIRKQKYRDILEQEINEKEVQKNQIKEIKKHEHEELEQSMKMVDRYDEEKKIQKKQVERLIQEQNKQLIAEKKIIEKEEKHHQIEQSQNSYTQQNLNIQRQIEDENQQKINKQRQFLSSLENQKKQQQDIKTNQRVVQAQQEQTHLNHLSQEEQQRRNDRDKIRYGYQAEKPTVYQQIDHAYKQKENKMKEFENHFINDGLQELIQKEKKMQDLIKQGKKQLQSQVDLIVGDQLVQKKQYQTYEYNHRNEERNQADLNYVNYKNAEKMRKNNQRELYQRQNFINQQQQQLKGHIKERQKHMNDNEIKINLDKLPESPNLPKSSSTMFQNGRNEYGGTQKRGNLIYMGDYVSYDREKQLKQVDIDLIEKQPLQSEQYKRTIQNKTNLSIQSNKEPHYVSPPQHFQSPNSNQNLQQLSNRSNSMMNNEKNKLYLQQARFPKQNAYVNKQSPPSLIQMSPDHHQINTQNQIERQQYQNNNQNINQSLPFRNQSSPQLQEVPQNQQPPQQKINQPMNGQHFKSQESLYYPPPPPSQQNIYPQQKQQNQIKQPLQEFSNSVNLNQQQVEQQNKPTSQSQVFKQQITSPQNRFSVTQAQRPLDQIMSPNGFYQQINKNLENNNGNQRKNNPPPPLQSQIPQSLPLPQGNNGQLGRRGNSNNEFNIKSIQYNNFNSQDTLSNRIPTDGQIRVYRSPQNQNQQNYHLPQMGRQQPPSNISQNSQGQFNNGSKGQHQNNPMSSSMNYLENRQNIVSSQKQDYNQIRQNNANWAQRGFNIISGN